MKKIMIVMALFGFMFANVIVAENEQAQDTKKEAVKKTPEKKVLQDLEYVGKIVKKQEESKKENAPIIEYFVLEAEGITLKLPKAKKNATVKAEDYVDKNVKVKGKGTVNKKGNKGSIKEIISIEEVTAQ